MFLPLNVTFQPGGNPSTSLSSHREPSAQQPHPPGIYPAREALSRSSLRFPGDFNFSSQLIYVSTDRPYYFSFLMVWYKHGMFLSTESFSSSRLPVSAFPMLFGFEAPHLPCSLIIAAPYLTYAYLFNHCFSPCNLDSLLSMPVLTLDCLTSNLLDLLKSPVNSYPHLRPGFPATRFK